MKTLSQLTFLDTLLQSGPDFPALEELIDTALAIYTHAHRHTDTHTHTLSLSLSLSHRGPFSGSNIRTSPLTADSSGVVWNPGR